MTSDMVQGIRKKRISKGLILSFIDWWLQDFPKRIIHMVVLRRHDTWTDCGYCNLHVCGGKDD